MVVILQSGLICFLKSVTSMLILAVKVRIIQAVKIPSFIAVLLPVTYGYGGYLMPSSTTVSALTNSGEAISLICITGRGYLKAPASVATASGCRQNISLANWRTR